MVYALLKLKVQNVVKKTGNIFKSFQYNNLEKNIEFKIISLFIYKPYVILSWKKLQVWNRFQDKTMLCFTFSLIHQACATYWVLSKHLEICVATLSVLSSGNQSLENFDIFCIFNQKMFTGNCLIWQCDYIGDWHFFLFPEENCINCKQLIELS